MRNLTLNEKITIKGALSKKIGISSYRLAKLDMKDALYLWSACYRKSIAEYWRVT